jgi:predicted RNase H-like HicB family nuclease
MTNTYTAIIKQDGEWWIGWIEELPGINCQERSREDLIQTLKETSKEALEFNRQEAIKAAAPEYFEEPLTI